MDLGSSYEHEIALAPEEEMSWNYLYVFFQSSTLEVFIYFLFFRTALSFRRTFTVVTLANSITHPLVFFGFMAGPWSYLTGILCAELFAIVAEASVHRKVVGLSWLKSFLASFWANLLSWQLAPILSYYLFLS